MEEQFPLLYHIALNIGLPVATLFAGWFGQAWRSKQKKDADQLENTQQILNIQKDYIADQQEVLIETRANNRRLEKKLDRKNRSISKANKCRYTSEGDGCPVLNNEDLESDREHEQDDCDNCKLKQTHDAQSED